MAARFTDEAGAGAGRAHSAAGQMREAGPTTTSQTSFRPDARERASQKARYWPSACE